MAEQTGLQAMIEIADILATQRPGVQPFAGSHVQGLRPSRPLPVMPFVTPYETLTMPITARGVGKNLRFGIVM